MISGLFLLVEKLFEIGDVIEVDVIIGEVVGIDMLSVKLCILDNLYVCIFNEILIKIWVVNWFWFFICWFDFIVGIVYVEDVEWVEVLLLNLVEKNLVCLEEFKLFVLVMVFGLLLVDLQFLFWVLKDKVLDGCSSIMVVIKQVLDWEGIEIFFLYISIYVGSYFEFFWVQLLGLDVIVNKELLDVD